MVNVPGLCFLMCFGAELTSICSRLPLTAPYWPDSFLRISHWVSLQNSELQKKKKKKKVEPRFLFIFHFQSYAFTFFFFKVHCVVLIYAGKWAFGSTRAHSDGRLTSAAWRLSLASAEMVFVHFIQFSVFFRLQCIWYCAHYDGCIS